MSDLVERESEVTRSPPGRVPEGRLRGILLPLLAFVALAVFLGILGWWVPRLDLIVVIALTLILAAIDFFARRTSG